MKKYFRLYIKLLNLNLMKALSYRGNFLFGVILTALESATSFFGISIIFSHINSLAGWNYGDMLVLNGIFMIMNALGWLLFRGGINDLDRTINRGDFDFYLIRPVSPQFLVSIQRIDLEDAARGVVGVAVIGYGLSLNHTHISLTSWPLFLLTIICGQAVLYSVFLSLKTISFKSIQGWATNNIAFRFQELTQYPTDVYRGILKTVYTFILPLIFVVTVPAKALLGKLSLEMAFGSIIVAGSSLFVARLFWQWGIKNYTSASS